MSKYFFIKENPNQHIIRDKSIGYKNFEEYIEKIKNDFQKYYGNFVTSIICDIGSIAIPILRFCNSNYLKSIVSIIPQAHNNIDCINVNIIKKQFFIQISSNK